MKELNRPPSSGNRRRTTRVRTASARSTRSARDRRNCRDSRLTACGAPHPCLAHLEGEGGRQNDLGERDGIEVLRFLGSAKIAAGVIIVSGSDKRILKSTAWVARSLGLNVCSVLSKPIRPNEFVAALNDWPLSEKVRDPAIENRPISYEYIRDAIHNREIVPYFQPKVDLATGRITGCEALARWVSPEREVCSPMHFLNAVEQFGLMGDLTTSMLDQSIEASKELQNGPCPVNVAVNISGADLSRIDLPERVEGMLGKYGVAPDLLTIEITETAAMADTLTATDVIIRLRLKGIHVAIDDFGTGYSSLAALAQMPFSELKIDQSFVRNCLADADMAKIVNVSIQLAKQLKMKSVAEGVCNAELARFLREALCDVGQGYYFSKALSRKRIAAMIEGNQRFECQ